MFWAVYTHDFTYVHVSVSNPQFCNKASLSESFVTCLANAGQCALGQYHNCVVSGFQISCASSVDAFTLFYKCFISSLYIKFYIFKIYEQSELLLASITILSYRRALLRAALSKIQSYNMFRF